MIPDKIQREGIQWILDRPSCALWWRAGEIGKTLPTLLALWDLYLLGDIQRILVLSTKYVADNVWHRELEHLPAMRDHLGCVRAIGNAKTRLAAIQSDAPLVTMNNENVNWLTEQKPWRFDTVVLDESSSYGNPKNVRFKSLRRVRGQIDRMIHLTGSPRSNSLLSVWSQIYLLDKGRRLGATFGSFKKRFFDMPNPIYQPYLILPKKGAKQEIYQTISDICHVAQKPSRRERPLVRDIPIRLPEKLQARYSQFQRDTVLEWSPEDDLDGVNAAVLRGRLLQFANGGIYREDRSLISIHDLKLDLVKELVATCVGEPVIVAYHFRYDLERLQKALPGAVLFGSEHYDAWNRGEIPVLLFRPASSAHGLNLQHGGCNLIFYSLPDSLDHYEQTIARLDRRNQRQRVIVRRIIVEDTVERAVAQNLASKNREQSFLFTYMVELRQQLIDEMNNTLETACG